MDKMKELEFERMKHRHAALEAHLENVRMLCAKICLQMPNRITKEQKQLMLMTSPYGGKDSASSLVDHDKQLLTRFAKYLNEHCDLHVENMVRPFLEGEQ